ncbi:MULTISPECIES: hypothetical protein [Reichenbachiella]|uniref:Uncharacterized protein n=1 Tax=Reichenbachiella agariperforans TaxID=156994 RepID=A0A1M6M306_REIAG|nr:MULTISPECIES: hypothetical protein [Reichenbachiella]MBU2914534.1 hypothetical protein [Reichenbachiella agariperforans]RJE73951.1 hypothetical protein BGP76_12125 [Reichenbachiella sp. MSK19-1]SHJ77805.1 hypothetical protein SAMN04488028_1011200 [Reichenbachiella agariperforans]
MEALIEFGKIILPAGAVLYAMFLMTRLFIRKEYDSKLIEIKLKNTEVVLPIRLAAYERICLFLERIMPKNLIVRLNVGEMSALEFHQVLLHEVREEFSHNVSQQVYMSVQAWEVVSSAMEEIVMIVNECASSLGEDAKSIDLARKVFERVMEREHLQVDYALVFIKEEIQQNF